MLYLRSFIELSIIVILVIMMLKEEKLIIFENKVINYLKEWLSVFKIAKSKEIGFSDFAKILYKAWREN